MFADFHGANIPNHDQFRADQDNPAEYGITKFCVHHQIISSSYRSNG